jgi:hypothetical protein
MQNRDCVTIRINSDRQQGNIVLTVKAPIGNILFEDIRLSAGTIEANDWTALGRHVPIRNGIHMR